MSEGSRAAFRGRRSFLACGSDAEAVWRLYFLEEALFYREPRIHLTFPSGEGAERSEAEEVFCLEFRFFCTFPRRAAPLPPLRGPPSPEEKVCSHPLKSK